MECFWTVVCTEQHRERWAAENVARQGCAFYLPQILSARRVKGRHRSLLLPQALFPRYLFVQIKNGQWRFLLSTFGIVEVLTNVVGPARVPETIINDLRSRQDRDGFVVLPQRPPKLRNGQKVKFTTGPFAGKIGIYEGSTAKERQQVLLAAIGGKFKVLIGEESLEAA